MLMLIAGCSFVAGSDNPHDGTSMPLGPSTPSDRFRLTLSGSISLCLRGDSRLGSGQPQTIARSSDIGGSGRKPASVPTSYVSLVNKRFMLTTIIGSTALDSGR